MRKNHVVKTDKYWCCLVEGDSKEAKDCIKEMMDDMFYTTTPDGKKIPRDIDSYGMSDISSIKKFLKHKKH